MCNYEATSPIRTITFKEAINELNDAVQSSSYTECPVILVDIDADTVIFLTDSNLSISELYNCWIEGSVMFITKDVS